MSKQLRNRRSTGPFLRKNRRHRLSAPCLLAAMVVLGIVWVAYALRLFFSNTDLDHAVQSVADRRENRAENLVYSLENDMESRNEQLDKQQSESPKAPSEKDESSKNDNTRQRYKDNNDYRRIKIETPAPDQHHDEKIEVMLANLTAHNPVYIGREKLVKMLLEMWIDVTQIDDSIWEQVPIWEDIVKVHGRAPVIHGLDTCADFREAVPEFDRRAGIAGLFSSGTNLLAILLQHNCGNKKRMEKLGRKKGHGMEWQVPWGKHSPAWYRGIGHVNNFIGQIDPDNMMVASMVRNPYDWMASMCRHGYTAKWDRNSKNCPNLYDGNEVNAKFGPGPSHHLSLAHMWNDWNRAYYNATFPRLMVRFEDVVFFPKETARKICTCVGGKLVTPKEHDGLFHYVIDSALVGKGHGAAQKRNGLIDAWIKYGKPRKFAFSESDMEYSERHLDKEMMDIFHWDSPSIPH